MNICPNCNAVLANNAKFCNSCGTKLFPKYICGKCGNIITNTTANFCRECGNKFDENNRPVEWGENDKFYRLCTYCGRAYQLEDNYVECIDCGHKLDLSPRRTDRLTEDEMAVINERKEKERKLKEEQRAEAQRVLDEKNAEIKKRLEEATERQRVVREKRLKIFKRVMIVSISAIVICGLIFGGIVYVWSLQDEKNIATANEAMAVGDYQTAIECYEKLMPLGSKYKTYQEQIESIAEAGSYYDKAVEDYESYSYLSSMENANTAVSIYSEFNIANDVYNQAQEALGQYLQKLYDEGNYSNAYKTISKIDSENLNVQMNNIKGSIESIADSKVSAGREAYDNNDMDSAILYAYQALSVISNYTEAENLKSDVQSYEKYEDYLNTASLCYKNGEYEEAVTNYDKVPNSYVGDKVLSEYPTLTANIENYKWYSNNPVIISNKASHGWYSNFHNNDYVDISCTIQNRLNLTVAVELKFEYNSRYMYQTYYLNGGETRTIEQTMYGVYVYEKSNESNITVYNTTIS